MTPKQPYIWNEECQALLELIEEELGIVGDDEESLQYRLGFIKEEVYLHRQAVKQVYHEAFIVLKTRRGRE